MGNTCMIKSYPKGIALVLDDKCEFEALVLDICELFANSKEFFGQQEMILSFEGRQLSAQETLIIIEAIELNSYIKVPLIEDNSSIRDARTIGLLDKFYFDRVDDNTKIYRGNVQAGDVVESETGLLVVGDVKRNGRVIAKGNVVVVGKIEGEVRAGEPDFSNAFIVAGKFLAKEAVISGVKGTVNVKYRGLRTSKIMAEPVVVKLLHGDFHCEPLSSGLARQDD